MFLIIFLDSPLLFQILKYVIFLNVANNWQIQYYYLALLESRKFF